MSSHRLREIPEHNCLTRLPKDVINLDHDQPCNVRKTTKDHYRDRDHEQEDDVTLVSADGNLILQTLLGDDKSFGASISTKQATTSKHGATTIEAEKAFVSLRRTIWEEVNRLVASSPRG